MRIKITSAIANEYANRLPEFLPLDKLNEGRCEVTEAEARSILADAEHNSDREAFDIGPYGMPLGTFNAYRSLAKQIRKALS
jgi:hypothetical protein